MKVKVDTKEWEKIKRRLLAKNYKVNIGWFQADRYGADNNNLPMAQVAQWVEEGHRGGWGPTPPRPAIRVEFMPNLINDKIYTKLIHTLVSSVANGTLTWHKANTSIGQYAEKKLKGTLVSYTSIPNSQTTIDIKGFNDPWRYTGQLISSVNYKIENIKR